MKRLLCSLVFVSVITLAVGVNAQDKKSQDGSGTKMDPASMAGPWKFESGERGGNKVASERLGTVEITKSAFTIPVPGGNSFVMAYKLDTSKTPTAIELEITAGDAPPSKSSGIIKMEDGKLMLCYNPTPGGDTPTEFKTSEDNGYHMFVMARRKISAKDLVGTYSYSAGWKSGEKVDDERLVGEVTISEKTITIPAGESSFVMSYDLNTDQYPAHIDMAVKEGPAPEGSPAIGIVTIQDGHLLICYDPMATDRPVSFEPIKDKDFFLFKLKKAKKED